MYKTRVRNNNVKNFLCEMQKWIVIRNIIEKCEDLFQYKVRQMGISIIVRKCKLWLQTWYKAKYGPDFDER